MAVFLKVKKRKNLSLQLIVTITKPDTTLIMNFSDSFSVQRSTVLTISLTETFSRDRLFIVCDCEVAITFGILF